MGADENQLGPISRSLPLEPGVDAALLVSLISPFRIFPTVHRYWQRSVLSISFVTSITTYQTPPPTLAVDQGTLPPHHQTMLDMY